MEEGQLSMAGDTRSTDYPGKFTPFCSVVICTRDRPDDLDRCLAAVARVTYPHLEVLVVDNAPSDQRTREVAERWGVRYVVAPEVGLSRARNLGAHASRGEVVAYIDDDSLPEPSWLGYIAAEFADPQVMGVTGRIRAREVQTVWDQVRSWMSGLDCGEAERKTFDRQTPSWFERANLGGIGTGGNMAFRRRAFEEGFAFDIRLGCGANLYTSEEHYAFFQLIDRGGRIVYTPHAVVFHPVPNSLEEIHERHRKSVTATAAYAMLLFVEEPGHRGAMLKFAFQRLTGTTPPWRLPVTALAGRIFPGWHRLLACLAGPWLYLRTRLKDPRPGKAPALLSERAQEMQRSEPASDRASA